MSNQESITKEDYKIKYLLQRIADLTSSYEEVIANQAVTIAILNSKLSDNDNKESGEEG